MLKSLWIKLPTLALAGLIIALVDGPQAWWWATAILLLGTLVLLHFVCNVRSSFLVRTLWNAPEATNAVALTFDDGPDPNYTSRVLDILAKHDVPAAFFVVGHRVRAHPELLLRAHSEGHVIGNHTESHSVFLHCRLWSKLRKEIADCNAAIQSVIGCLPTLFRPPHGFKNPALADVVRARRAREDDEIDGAVIKVARAFLLLLFSLVFFLFPSFFPSLSYPKAHFFPQGIFSEQIFPQTKFFSSTSPSPIPPPSFFPSFVPYFLLSPLSPPSFSLFFSFFLLFLLLFSFFLPFSLPFSSFFLYPFSSA